MATQLVRCPQCGAVPHGAPDPHGTYVCSYCHARFQVKPAALPAVPRHVSAPAAPGSGAGLGIALFFAGLILVVVALGVTALVVQRQRKHEAAPSPTFTVTNVPALSGVPLIGPHGEDEPKATATFELHGRKSGYQSSFYVLGMVKNTSPFAIDKPKVAVVLRDKAGKELTSRDGYAERDVLEPGESSPIKVLVSDPPPHQELSFEVVARRSLYQPGKVEGLKVEQEGPPRQNFGTWEIAGKVLHEGNVPARFVKVECLIRNKAGKLIGIESTYADGERLDPKDSARFRVSALLDEKPEKIELSVSARPAK